MQTYVCACGRVHVLGDANRCPYCNMYLVNHTDDYIRKHINRCSTSVAPRVYSNRYKGRPTKKDVEDHKDIFRKHCRNCGTAHCVGCDEGVCEDWTPQQIGRCPFCGRMPVLDEVENIYVIICDECNVKMIDEDKNALISRWNRT